VDCYEINRARVQEATSLDRKPKVVERRINGKIG